MIPNPTEILLQYMVSRALTQPEHSNALTANLDDLAQLFVLDEGWFGNPSFLPINQAISNIIARQMTIMDRVYVLQASQSISQQFENDELTDVLTESADAIFEDGIINWSKFAAMISFIAEVCIMKLVHNDPTQVMLIADWWENYLWKPIQDGPFLNEWLHNHNIWCGLVNQGAHQVNCLPIVNPNVEVPAIPNDYTPFQNMSGDV